MELKGNLKVINNVHQVSEKFKKRDVVLTTTDGRYNQDVLIQFTNVNVDLVDEFVIGDEVVIGINIRGREWVGATGEVKYFNTIEGWRITGVAKSRVTENSAPKPQPSKIEPVDTLGVDEDGLPF